MKITFQKQIDFEGLGARWACTFTGPINAMEWTRQERFTDEEIDEIVGHCFRRKYAWMSNYPDHSDLNKVADDILNWELDDPEWHYLVKEREKFVRYLEVRFKTTLNRKVFNVAIMKTQFGTKHWCIQVVGGPLLNPDPELKGPIVKTKPFIY